MFPSALVARRPSPARLGVPGLVRATLVLLPWLAVPLPVQAQTPAVTAPSGIRNVSPPGVVAPPVTGPLIRVAPAGKLAEPKDPEAGLPKDAFDVKGAVVLDGGTLKAGRLIVRIAHVEGLAPTQTCTSRLGGDWPCGARARASLQGLVRAYTLACRRVAALGEREISAVCTKGPTDVGLWLVRQGWATPAAEAPEAYRQAVDEAREAKVGQWQAEWVAELAPPMLVTPVEPVLAVPGDAGAAPLVVLPAGPSAATDGTGPSGQWLNPFDVQDPDGAGTAGPAGPD
ncbi:hypothetical protein GWI72_11120 [Microvirga tunisiensis]|uniref:Thermonuclease family protein n=1 Tax=Pannonibacter tanglangensis TaxID=2750084 RepID=A0A7X5F5D3_9HYPH|nr:hypothetical protein [Pannonibacter sp. XCT-53]NBN78819.1 hypothetical protein [Pannonibacter sp. XCT-53]